ncbi:hypothetical protein PG985_010274 [Apiospora marii]|uniref:uncharacterized protein n=1 Tax=Apiospora marii TaxID=335849 RepID=UPI00312E21EC
MPWFCLWRRSGAKRGTTNAIIPARVASPAVPQPQATPTDSYVKLWTLAFESLSKGTRQDRDDSQRLKDVFDLGAPSAFNTGEDVLANLVLESQRRKEDADARSWKVQLGPRVWVLSDVTDKFRTWLVRFREVGDIAVSFDPVHAALPWAAFRFILQQSAEILLGLERAMKMCLRCRIYENLYLDASSQGRESSTALRHSIVEIFKCVLSFLSVASVQITKTQNLKDAVHSVAMPNRFTSRLSELTRLESEVEVAAQNCHREANREAHKSFETAHHQLLDLLDERFSRLDDTVASIWASITDDDRVGSQIMPCTRVKYLDKKAHEFASDQFTLDECRDLLTELTSIYAQSTFIIDGLDECDERTRYILIETIDYTFGKSRRLVKVFIASRDDGDIKEQYGGGENLSIRASHNQGDIDTYVKTKIEETKWCREKMSRQTKDMIQEVFSRKSNGMFQWAALHINDLLRLNSEALIVDYLNTLPEGLAATYAQIYNSIDKRKRHIVDRAFQWLICSWDELAPEELEIAVSQQFDAPFSSKVQFDIEFIVTTCKNLIEVVTESFGTKKTCRFVHLSVREYFEEHHWRPETANNLILRHPHDSSSSYRSWANNLLCTTDASLLEYVDTANSLFSSPSVYTKISVAGKQASTLPATELGIHDALRAWLIRGELDPNARDSIGSTALDIAIKTGHEHICELLLAEGADANLAVGEFASALVAAAVKGMDGMNIVRILLGKGGANPNIQGGYFGSPLQAAAMTGCEPLVRLLLEHDANPNAIGGRYGTALQSAASQSHNEVCRILLEAGANVNLGGGTFGTPLLAAIEQGDIAMAELLLSFGADINGCDSDGINVLHKAVIWGTAGVPMTRFLIDRGANVNAYSSRLGTPLQAALSVRDPLPGVVEILRNAGAVYDEARVPPGNLTTRVRQILGIVDDDQYQSSGSEAPSFVSNATYRECDR